MIMAEIVKSKTQLLLEILIAISLAVFVIYAPTLVGTTLIPADSQLAPLVPVAIGIVYIAAYEFLSVEGYAVFKDMLEKLKGTRIKSGDQGSMSPLAYFIIAILGLVVLAAMAAVYVFHVDLVAVLAGAVLLVIGAVAVLFKKPAQDHDDSPPWLELRMHLGWMTAFVDVAKWRTSTEYPATLNCEKSEPYFDIMATFKDKVWVEPNAFVKLVGDRYVVCSMYAAQDPFMDNTPDETPGDDVLLEMGRLPSGAEQLKFIMAKIAGKGIDIAYLQDLKAVLCMGQAEVDRMKSGKAGPTAYQDFVNDVNPAPYNLTAVWQAHLKHDDYLLRREADSVYWKYYKEN